MQKIDELTNKKTRLEMVKEFHELFKLKIGDKPDVENEELASLRVRLIDEEFDELMKALDEYLEHGGKNYLVDVLDALLDLEYVLLGAVISFGMQDIFDKAFEEVHRSNMTKLYYYKDQHHFDEEVKSLRNKYGFDLAFEPSKKNVSIIRRLSDGKVLKPSEYSPAELKQFISE